MGWGSGTNDAGREIGYLIEAECDEPGCDTRIDRGLAYACGGMHDGGEHGCGGYFCDAHLFFACPPDGRRGPLCDRCSNHPRRPPMPTDRTFKPGDRVYVTDPGLAELRAIMRRHGHDPAPNHHGTVNEIWDDGMVEIWFDNEDGPGQGQSAPYPPQEVEHLPDCTEVPTDA